MYIKSIATAAIIIACATYDADAIQYRRDRASVKITGYGNAGLIEPDFQDPLFLGDWRVRAQGNYAIAAGQTLGAVYSIDAQTVDGDEYIDDLFLLYENRQYGRIEFGLTESIAGKLGLGVPDVGGLRMNDNPLFYKKISPHGPVIADTALDTGDQSLRINIASVPTGVAQYGLSIAGGRHDYKFAADGGIKIRRPAGKLKTAISIGASYMDRPDNFNADPYAPNVTADWRTQLTAGVNIQYNSWIWGLSGRAIYDKNPIGIASDGISVGSGVSYDLMKYSVSLSYLFSDTGIWHGDAEKYADHTVMASMRYKYSENVWGWTSVGMTTKTPFVAAGIRLNF